MKVAVISPGDVPCLALFGQPSTDSTHTLTPACKSCGHVNSPVFPCISHDIHLPHIQDVNGLIMSQARPCLS